MRWRSVIGFLAGRSFGSPLASKPSSTCGVARSGSSLPIGSSSESLPCSTSCMRGRGRDRLGHGGDPEHAVGGHRHRPWTGRACRTRPDKSPRCRSPPSRPRRESPWPRFLTQNLIDLSFALHGSPPGLIFMEWRDLPPGRAIPQAAADGRCRCRDLVMAARGGQRWRGMAAQTATPGHNRRWIGALCR